MLKLRFFKSALKDTSNIKQDNGMDEVKYYSTSFMKIMDIFQNDDKLKTILKVSTSLEEIRLSFD